MLSDIGFLCFVFCDQGIKDKIDISHLGDDGHLFSFSFADETIVIQKNRRVGVLKQGYQRMRHRGSGAGVRLRMCQLRGQG